MAGIKEEVVCPKCGKPYKTIYIMSPSHSSGSTRSQCNGCKAYFKYEVKNGKLYTYIEKK